MPSMEAESTTGAQEKFSWMKIVNIFFFTDDVGMAQLPKQ